MFTRPGSHMVQINKDPPFFGRSSDGFTGGKDAMVSTIDFPFNQSIVPLSMYVHQNGKMHLISFDGEIRKFMKIPNKKRMSWDFLFNKNVGKCLHAPH